VLELGSRGACFLCVGIFNSNKLQCFANRKNLHSTHYAMNDTAPFQFSKVSVSCE
jgi:hypothetical protein